VHEFGVTKSLVELCNKEAEKNRINKVYRIYLRIGRFTGFSPDSIKFYFAHMKANTRCDTAELVFEEIPIRIKCKNCNKESKIDEPVLLCPDCGSNEIDLLSGREFFVASIEGE
jgi:hydrogenase nickel incorporation protein HypA/HybF